MDGTSLILNVMDSAEGDRRQGAGRVANADLAGLQSLLHAQRYAGKPRPPSPHSADWTYQQPHQYL